MLEDPESTRRHSHHLHGCHALKVGLADTDVLLVHLLRKVQHVGREERLAVLREELLKG